MEQRLQKVMAGYGVASRRQAEQMILDGRVRVNGNTAKLGDKVEDDDIIQLDDKVLNQKPEKVYIMLHKPRGFVTTMHDEQGRKDVSQLVSDCKERVYPVGRLDLSSEGLLIMTNDGDVANRLMHPSGQVEKVYLAWVNGYYEGAEEKLRKPMNIDGYITRPADANLHGKSGVATVIEIVIREGRNRQVRKMCEEADLHVTRLRRIREGKLELGKLEAGGWRFLTEEEITYLKNL